MRLLAGPYAVGLCAVGLMAGACQSGVAAPQPALLLQGDTGAMGQLTIALEKEMARSPINLGPSDPTHSPMISVLPVPAGPLNDRDMALPTVFRLQIDGQGCALMREGTHRRIGLAGVKCRAVPGQ